MKNEHAAALGRLNLGRKKHLTPDQRARAALRAAHARACRAAKRTFDTTGKRSASACVIAKQTDKEGKCNE